MSDHELIYQALRFYFWAAGEGICPVDSDAALEPEEGFWQYGLRTGDHDWETVAQRYRDSDAGQRPQRGERPQWSEGETWAETITKLREIKSDDEIEAEMAISRAGIERWASGAGKPRPSTQAALRRMIYEWLAEGGLVPAALQSPPPVVSGEADADSGMSGDDVQRAEWAWANLPTGNRSWASLPTAEKALVCHVLSRVASNALTPPVVGEGRREAIKAIVGRYSRWLDDDDCNAIADAILALTPVSASPDAPKRPGFRDA